MRSEISICLICDAMSIKNRRQQWDKKRDKFWGYCDFGKIEVEGMKEREATEVMVFMCACLNGSWRLPIGYFFQDKCSASFLGELIKKALCLCDQAQLRVHSFTCDGTNTNWFSLKTFGFINDFNPEDIQFELKYESKDVTKTVYFTPDARHAVKLARNALATYKQFCIGDDIIKWEFIEMLHELQEKLHFIFANKLTKTHIHFRNSIMKVKYTVQVLSSSVADAIDFLRSLKLPDFQWSEETVTFLRTVDRVFDFLNSRSLFGKGYKRPIRTGNLEFFKKEFNKWINYFLQLKTVSGQPFRKAFIISFATCIKSVLTVSEKILYSNYYSYVLTYKFSQDLLELFFAIIRLRFGCNNNPSAFQFYCAMKTILLKNDITSSASGNCLLFDAQEKDSYTYGNFLSVKQKTKKSEMSLNDTYTDFDEKEEELLKFLLEMEEINPKGILRDYILYYISGFIVRKLTKNILHCCDCKKAILKPLNVHNYCTSLLFDRFVQHKNRGGLIFALTMF